MSTAGRLVWAQLVALTLVFSLTPRALAQEDAHVDLRADPETVTPGGEIVRFSVEVVVPAAQQPATITALTSDLYGDISDGTNPAIHSTTCSVPVAYLETPGWVGMACFFEVFVSGDPGVVASTVSATIVLVDGTEVTVSDTATVTLTPDLGTIRGILVNAETGQPVPGVFVFGDAGFGGFTGPDGTVTFIGLEPGEYRLRSGSADPGGWTPAPPADYRTEFAFEYYDENPTGPVDYSNPGDPVVVLPGETTEITWELNVGGEIEGFVTSTSGQPVTEFTIYYWIASQDGSPSPSAVGGNGGGPVVSADGRYRLWGLRAGNYHVCIETSYGAECWDDHATTTPINSPRSGDPISVALGQTVSGVSAQFDTGTVTTSDESSDSDEDGGSGTLPYTGDMSLVVAIVALAIVTTGTGALWFTRRGLPHRAPRS